MNVQTIGTIPQGGGAISFSYKTNGSCNPSTAAITWLPKIEYQDGVSASSYNHFDVQYKTDIPHGEYVQISCDTTSEGDETLYEVLLLPMINGEVCNGILVSQANRDCDCSGLWYFTSYPVDSMGNSPGDMIATFNFAGCDQSDLSFELVGGPSVHIENGDSVVVDSGISPISPELPYRDFQLKAYFDGNPCKTIMVRQEGKVPCSCQNSLNYVFHGLNRRFSSAGTYNSSTHDYDEIMVASGSSACGIIKANDTMGTIIVDGSIHTVNDGNDFYVYAKIKQSPTPQYEVTNIITYRFQKNGGTEIDNNCLFYSEIVEINGDEGCKTCGNPNKELDTYIYNPSPYNGTLVTIPWRGIALGHHVNGLLASNLIYNYKGYVLASQVPKFKNYISTGTLTAGTEGYLPNCYGVDTIDGNDENVMIGMEYYYTPGGSSPEYWNSIKVIPINVRENISLTPREFDAQLGIYTDHYYSIDVNGKEHYTKGKFCSGVTYHISQSGAPCPTCIELFPNKSDSTTNSSTYLGINSGSYIYDTRIYDNRNACISFPVINSSQETYQLILGCDGPSDGSSALYPKYTPYDYYYEYEEDNPFARWSIQKIPESGFTYKGVTYPKTADWVVNIGQLEEEIGIEHDSHRDDPLPGQYNFMRGKADITLDPFVGDKTCTSCSGDCLPDGFTIIASRCTTIKLKYDDHEGVVCERPVRIMQYTAEEPTPPEPTPSCSDYTENVNLWPTVSSGGGIIYAAGCVRVISPDVASIGDFQVTSYTQSAFEAAPKWFRGHSGYTEACGAAPGTDANPGVYHLKIKPSQNTGYTFRGTIKSTFKINLKNGKTLSCNSTIQYDQQGEPLPPSCNYGTASLSLGASSLNVCAGQTYYVNFTVDNTATKDGCFKVRAASQSAEYATVSINGQETVVATSGQIKIDIINPPVGQQFAIDVYLLKDTEEQLEVKKIYLTRQEC